MKLIPHIQESMPMCLLCGVRLNAHGGPGDVEDGDASVCVHCGNVAMFVVKDGAISLRALTTGEESRLATDKEWEAVRKARETVRTFRKLSGPPQKEQ